MNYEDCEKIAYKSTEGRELYLYAFYPQNATGKRSAVLCIHGGGWERESPAILFEHARYFAAHGFVALCPEYRLMQKGGNVLPCLEDSVDAALYVKRNADKLGIDENFINVLGESAGGYLACCLGSKKIMQRVRPDCVPVACKIIDINGISDLTGYWKYALAEASETDDEKAFLRGFDKRYELSPVYNVSENDPSVFIMHGLKDSIVDTQDSLRYAKALAAANVECETILIKGAEHAFILFGFVTPDRKIYELLDCIISKLKR